ncbi:MAG: DUF4198 domain-containing protein [Planctomycetes bacterium]|nr:DUF4198 domain-containing protein [Planctomycetota bacterium]
MTAARRASAAVVLALAAVSAWANDFWLTPSGWRPKVGEEVSIRLMNGRAPKGEARKRDDARIDTFVARGPDGQEQAIVGASGADPAGVFKPDDDGLWIAGFRSKPASVALDAVKFEAYLKSEGLEHVIEERAALGESAAKGREIYVRCAKAFVQAGTPQRDGHAKALGFRIEILPEKNPTRAAPGDEIPFQVLFDSKPVAGVLVRALSAAEAEPSVESRTDAEGRVKLKLPRAGAWFVGGVHMVRSDVTKTFADWESWWASLTFEIPEPAATVPAAPGTK